MLVNGRRLNACLTLAVMHQGAEITTIEGLGSPDNLQPTRVGHFNLIEPEPVHIRWRVWSVT